MHNITVNHDSTLPHHGCNKIFRAALAALFTLTFWLSGCMDTPRDMSTISNKNDFVFFSGLHLYPDHDITIEALDWKNGQWETIGTAKTGSVKFANKLFPEHYRWWNFMVIPEKYWEPRLKGERVKTRSRFAPGGAFPNGGHSLSLMPENYRKQPGDICGDTVVEGGGKQCLTDNSPVAQIQTYSVQTYGNQKD